MDLTDEQWNIVEPYDPHASSPLGWQGAPLAGTARSAERTSLDPSYLCSLALSASSISSVPDLPSALPEVGYRGRPGKRSCDPSAAPQRARRTRPFGVLHRRHVRGGQKWGKLRRKDQARKGNEAHGDSRQLRSSRGRVRSERFA